MFISTELIKKAFLNKDNVNDALLYIIDEINEEMLNIWNIKITSLDKSKTKFCLHDINLHERGPNLMFDVTSDRSIVTNCNYKFVKDTALSNMIAIGNLRAPTYLSETRMGQLMHLNALNGTGEQNFVRVKSLPFDGYINNASSRFVSFDQEELPLESNDQIDTTELNNFNVTWNAYFESKKKLLQRKEIITWPNRIEILGFELHHGKSKALSSKSKIIK